MMMYKPTLILKRLVIQKSGKLAYDQFFHEGVNIIRGANASGKSTIVESIFYVLGGDIPKKKDEFLSCDFVYGEFEINDTIFTLKREIKVGYPSIGIFEGNYEQAITDGHAWHLYPNARSDTKKSYSEILFSLLELPEDKTPDGQNVTMNDILRLIFEDQSTASRKIFLSQYHFEKDIKRQAISDLLLGIDDSGLLSLKLQLNNNEKEFSSYDGQLKKISEVLGNANMDISDISLAKEKNEIYNEQEQIKNKIKNLYVDDVSTSMKNANENFAVIKGKISKVKHDISIAEQKVKSLLFEVEDSCEFIASLDIKLDALSVSNEITKTIGIIKLAHCPSCFEELKEQSNQGKCALCKSDLKDDGLPVGLLKMRNEISFQKRESKDIVKEKRMRIQKLEAELHSLNEELKILEHHSQNFINVPNPIEAELRTLLEKSGYLHRALEDVLKREELRDKVSDISVKKTELNLIISQLKDKISAVENLREKRKREIYTDINDTTINLIRNDSTKEVEYIDEISFDFAKDDLLAVGKASPAASTGSYLKNAFFFSLFLISLKHDTVRYPRFIIMDNIEDKGLEIPRIQQFHKDIRSHSDESNIKHQIIFTARSEVVTEDLKKSGLCIGEDYDGKEGKYSLHFAQKTEQN